MIESLMSMRNYKYEVFVKYNHRIVEKT